MMNDIVLAKLRQQVNADLTLTWIAIFQVLGSALFYNLQMELAELEKRGVTQQVFGQWTKDCEKMEGPPSPKVDNTGTNVYTPLSLLSPTCIHIVGGDPDHLLDSDHDTDDE